MANDGKGLESLVAFVEKTLLPQGFGVATNERVFDEDGVQIAEFDVEIRGKIGTTNIAWLIECRDRPGQGAAPGSWIEQLVGRRSRFGFNKVTAVSTTGFSAGAIKFAKEQGIELRVVEALEPDHFKDWLVMRHFSQIKNHANLEKGSVLLAETESPENLAAVTDVLAAKGDAPVLRSTATGKVHPLTEAFLGVIENQKLFEGITANGEPVPVRFTALYSSDQDHFVIDTAAGPIRVKAIIFTGTLTVTETLIPLKATVEYRNEDGTESISQVALFDAAEVNGIRFSMEMHKLSDTGETHVLLRKLPGQSGPDGG